MEVCYIGVNFSMDYPEDGVIKFLRNLLPTLKLALPYVAEGNLKCEIQSDFPDRYAIR